MLPLNRRFTRFAAAAIVMTAMVMVAAPSAAQAPPSYPAIDLDRLVARIALYPDPLVAQILAAATFSDEIPDAAEWADRHHYLTAGALARTMSEDELPWDPSVQALLPFPSVLGMMASDRGWTGDLGNAFLAQPEDVTDAVQRMRRSAREFGYLRSNAQVVVSGGPYIEILPVNPAFIYVPYYDPLIVFARPRPGFVVRGAVRFGYGVTIGTAFQPWGWGTNRVMWSTRSVIINNAPWHRTWGNRTSYVHPYTVRRYTAPRPAERHEVHERTQRERESERDSHKQQEEHRARGRDQRDKKER